MTAFVSFIAVFLIVDWPSQARFLNIEEKALLRRILAEDGGDEACSKKIPQSLFLNFYVFILAWPLQKLFLQITTTS